MLHNKSGIGGSMLIRLNGIRKIAEKVMGCSA